MRNLPNTPAAQNSLCRRITVVRLILLLAGLAALRPTNLSGQQPAPGASGNSTTPQTSNRQPSLSLSPSVIVAKGTFGQGITEELTLTNFTNSTLGFKLMAEDVTTKDGQRMFVPAGEAPGSIAATAAFSAAEVEIKPYSSATAKITFTIPRQTDLRAVVAIFRGTGIAATKGSVGMVASLGTLFVFTLSDGFKVEASPLSVAPQTNTANTTFEQWLTNEGTEPVMPEGAAAVLTNAGTLVGKTTIPSQRLLPGEKLSFKASYPAPLDPGHYRVLASYQFEGRTLNSSQDFTVQ